MEKFTNSPSNDFKKTIDRDTQIRKRQIYSLNNRKRRREENMQKKRKELDDSSLPLHLVIDDSNDDDNLFEEEFTFVAHVFSGNDLHYLKDAVVTLRQLSSISSRPPMMEIINYGFVQHLIAFLRHEDISIVYESSWTLTNIVSGTAEETKFCVEQGLVDEFKLLLAHTKDQNTRDQVVWGLGNIAGDNVDYRDMLLSKNILNDILPSFSFTSVGSIGTATWTLSNLLRSEPKPSLEVAYPCLQYFPNLLQINDNEILADALWCLSYISDGENDRIEAIIASGISARLISLLVHPDSTVTIPALRTVGNLATGTSKHTQALLDARLLQNIEPLLFSDKRGIRKEAVWTVSNITAGKEDHIDLILQTTIIPKLIQILCDADHNDVRREACWAICNIASSGSSKQIYQLSLMPKCVYALCEMLLTSETQICQLILETLFIFLEIAGGKNVDNPVREEIERGGSTDIIEMMQDHKSKSVYIAASRILRSYFELEDNPPTVSMASNFDF